MTIATLCGFLSVGHPQPVDSSDPGQDKLARDLFKASGLDEQIPRIPVMAVASLTDPVNRLPEGTLPALRGLVEDAYRRDELAELVLRRFRDEAGSLHTAMIMEWYRTPFAKRIWKLEKAAATPEALTEMGEFVSILKFNPPSGNRLAFIRNIDANTHATRVSVNLRLIRRFINLVALDAMLPRERQTGGERIRQSLESHREALTKKVEQSSVVRMLYIYRGLSDDDLRRYSAFLKSDSGIWFHDLVESALEEAFREAAYKLTQLLSHDLQVMLKKKTA